MYPSDQVWKGVYKSLHGRRRWRWAGLAIVLLSIGLYTGNWYLSGKPASKLAKNIQSSISAANQFPQASAAPRLSIDPNNNNSGSTQLAMENSNLDRRNSSQPVNTVNGFFINSGSDIYSTENSQIISNGMDNWRSSLLNGAETLTEKPSIEIKNAQQQAVNNAAEKALTNFADASSEAGHPGNKQGINWLEEYAVFRLTPARQKRYGLQLHFSPTLNYRRLSGNTFYPDVKSIPLSPNIVGDVDQYVKHRPALGFELGANLLYRSSNRITFKGGLQFNYSRYEIEAYSAPVPEIATIALNNQTFINDTISRYSRIRNLSGYEQENLSNQYFQLSMPVGLEFRVLSAGKLQLNVAGTIQPTYLLNRNSYLITTDYKNYTREPSLVRRWNVNGGLEAYVSYFTGTVRWQVGPQFRDQLFSTYSQKYPIKEQLMEYGLKVGVSKTIR